MQKVYRSNSGAVDNTFLEISVGYHFLTKLGMDSEERLRFAGGLGIRFLANSSQVEIRNNTSEVVD